MSFEKAVDGVWGTFILLFLLFLFVGVFFFFHGRVVSIPERPSEFILRPAVFYQDLRPGSKGSTYLYIRVAEYGAAPAYDRVIAARTHDINNLVVRKGQALQVAVDSSGSSQFIWGVFDERGDVLIDASTIQRWVKGSNFSSYAAMLFIVLGIVWLSFLILQKIYFSRFRGIKRK